MKESPILHAVRGAIARESSGCVWRNNTGVDVTRGVRYGLGIGGADIVACVPVACECGITVGRFCGFEVKTATGKLTPEQRLWRDAVTRAGGAYHLVRSAEEAVHALQLVRAIEVPK
jgi:hypothetical protein